MASPLQQQPTILVLGGYGGTGRVFCRYLLQETAVNLIVAGRRLEAARALAAELHREFPPARITSRHADAADPASLRAALQGVDLLLVAATTTQWASQIAAAALEAGCDYLDIYFRQETYPLLTALGERIRAAGRCFITQAGFHPGLPAAYIRKGAAYFDSYDRAVVAFAMHARIERPESVYELVDLLADYRPQIFRAGQWRAGTYRDAIMVDYGPPFGVRNSMPLTMAELAPLPAMLGLTETGVFAAGFNWFVDYLLTPAIMLAQKIRPGALRHLWAQGLIFGINTFSGPEEGVVFVLQAQGLKEGRRQGLVLRSHHASPYDFTVIPVIACLKQYLAGSIRRPGLWMMGHLVDPDRLLADMAGMGVSHETRITVAE